MQQRAITARRAAARWNGGSPEGYCDSSTRKWTRSYFRDPFYSLKHTALRTRYPSMIKVYDKGFQAEMYKILLKYLALF